MFRIKLVLLLVVLLAGMAGITMVLTNRAAAELLVSAEESLQSSNAVVQLASGVQSYSVMVEARDIAANASVLSAMGCPATDDALRAARTPPPAADGTPTQPTTDCVATQHDAMLAALRGWNAERERARVDNERRYLSERDPGYALPRAPDILVVADADGTVVGRVGFDKDDWFGERAPNLSDYPAVARTEMGGGEQDLVLWREHASGPGRLARIGAAPLYDNGRYVGSAVVGYLVSDGVADENLALLYDVDVAYFYRGDGNDVTFAGTTSAARTRFWSAVSGATFSREGAADISLEELALQRNGMVYTFEDSGQDYIAMATPLAFDAAGTSVTAGYIVIGSASGAVAPLSRLKSIVPLCALAFLLLGVLGVAAAFSEFMKPIVEVSHGVQEVIAGNREYMWDVDERSHLAVLAQSLNIMSARLQGKRDPDEDITDGDADWDAMASSGGHRSVKPTAVAGLGGIRGRSAAEDDTE